MVILLIVFFKRYNQNLNAEIISSKQNRLI